MKHLLMLFTATLITLSAQAQDFGVLAGLHSATATMPVISFSSELNYRLGVVMKYEIKDNIAFRSGLTYTTRHLASDTGGLGLKLNYEYLDIPVLFQFQMNETVAFFAGPVVGINVGKKGSASGVASSNIDGTKSLYLLGQVGANFTFDQIGFDVYYERGFGTISSDSGTTVSDFSIFGANFLFWF